MYLEKDIRYVNYTCWNMFEVKWHVTNWCNYRCPYCIQGSHKGIKWLPEEVVIERAKNLNKLLKEKNKWISLQILGGEVCFYNWPKILNEINNVKLVFITTNFSNKLEYFKELYDYCASRGIYLKLLCSYHETGDSFFEKILELSYWCREKHYRCPSLTFVVNNDFDFSPFFKFPELCNLGKDFCNMEIHEIRRAVDLNEEVKKKIKEIRNLPPTWEKVQLDIKIPTSNWQFGIDKEHIMCPPSDVFRELEDHHLKGSRYYCDAGINSFSISYNGNISRCDNTSGVIGNIDELKLDKLTTSRCDSNSCLLCQAVNLQRINTTNFDPFIVTDENEVK